MARTILITGCSDGGLGAGLAIAFHHRGDRVFATARNIAKMTGLQALGIKTLPLDVLEENSIKDCARVVADLTGGSLDVLINNAGAGYNMPLVDASIAECQKLFDLNVWAVLRTTQLFMPLLLNSISTAMVVNNTSVNSVIGTPLAGPYNASKAAAAMISETLRLELQPFGIKVIDLKTGGVKSNFYDNVNVRSQVALPETSIYTPAKAKLESIMSQGMDISYMPLDIWAKRVANDLSSSSPPAQVWRGEGATRIRIATFLPIGTLDSKLKEIGGIKVLEEELQRSKKVA